MMLLEVVPVVVVLLGLVIAFEYGWRRRPCAHDRADIMCGCGIVFLCAGLIEIAIRVGDIVSLVMILTGAFIAVGYGIDHLRARRVERRKLEGAERVLREENGKQTVE